MTDISDAYESSYNIMLNLNRTWAAKQGDFFVESPTILFAAIIWFLRIYKDGKYCTFPHAVEFLNKPYEQIFPIMSSYPIPNWRTTSALSSTHGSPGLPTSSWGRLLRPRYRSRA